MQRRGGERENCPGHASKRFTAKNCGPLAPAPGSSAAAAAATRRRRPGGGDGSPNSKKKSFPCEFFEKIACTELKPPWMTTVKLVLGGNQLDQGLCGGSEKWQKYVQEHCVGKYLCDRSACRADAAAGAARGHVATILACRWGCGALVLTGGLATGRRTHLTRSDLI